MRFNIDERDVAVRWIINAVSKCNLYRDVYLHYSQVDINTVDLAEVEQRLNKHYTEIIEPQLKSKKPTSGHNGPSASNYQNRNSNKKPKNNRSQDATMSSLIHTLQSLTAGKNTKLLNSITHYNNNQSRDRSSGQNKSNRYPKKYGARVERHRYAGRFTNEGRGG